MMPQRIVITSLDYYRDLPSGSARLAFDEAVYLASLGHQVWHVMQDRSRARPEKAFHQGCHVLFYPSPNLSVLNPNRFSIHQRLTAQVLRKHGPAAVDLVRGHSLLNYAGALKLYGADVRRSYAVHSPVYLEILANRRPGIMAQLSARLRALFLNRIERTCLMRTDVITAFSQYTRALLREAHGPAVADRTFVAPGWVDTERFRIVPDRAQAKVDLGWPTDRPVLFSLRRLVCRMGLSKLLLALRRVRDANVPFRMIVGGDGPIRGALESQARALGLAEEVRFVGRVPDTLLPLMYGAADAFILPTAELECFGLIAIEAMACGRPVLATPVGAIPEVVGPVEKRWLSGSSRMEDLAGLLLAFLKGDLPVHTPEYVRRKTADSYSAAGMLKVYGSMLTE